jgi:hypothetical protein
MTLWRRFNDIKDLEQIVEMMDFTVEDTTGKYSHPFYNKRYPVVPPRLSDILKSKEYIEHCNEMKTHMISNFVYRNVGWNHASGNVKAQFNKAKDAFYYYKRMEKNGY